MQFIVIGGVPGAGKSTALAAVRTLPRVLVLDPDLLRPRLRCRPLVHTVHQFLVWLVLVVGPLVNRTVFVHETATRRRRRTAMLTAARWRGWEVRLVMMNTGRAEALAGQYARGRMVSSASFDTHWRRWSSTNTQQLLADPTTIVVDREESVAALTALAQSPLARAGVERARTGVTRPAPLARRKVSTARRVALAALVSVATIALIEGSAAAGTSAAALSEHPGVQTEGQTTTAACSQPAM